MSSHRVSVRVAPGLYVRGGLFLGLLWLFAAMFYALGFCTVWFVVAIGKAVAYARSHSWKAVQADIARVAHRRW